MADHRRRKDVRRQIIQKVVLLKYHLFHLPPTPPIYINTIVYREYIYAYARIMRDRIRAGARESTFKHHFLPKMRKKRTLIIRHLQDFA